MTFLTSDFQKYHKGLRKDNGIKVVSLGTKARAGMISSTRKHRNDSRSIFGKSQGKGTKAEGLRRNGDLLSRWTNTETVCTGTSQAITQHANSDYKDVISDVCATAKDKPVADSDGSLMRISVK